MSPESLRLYGTEAIYASTNLSPVRIVLVESQAKDLDLDFVVLDLGSCRPLSTAHGEREMKSIRHFRRK